MATISKLDSTREDKGKMVIAEAEMIAISDPGPIHCNKTIEAVANNPITKNYTKQGTLIQANMDVKDADYFDQLLQHRKAYRISGFSREQTDVQPSNNVLQWENFNFEGDTKRWLSNNDTDGKDVIELLTLTNNPDGAIYDHAYYGPQVLKWAPTSDSVNELSVDMELFRGFLKLTHDFAEAFDLSNVWCLTILYWYYLILLLSINDKVMERLGEDEVSCIFERISNREDKNSFAIVCKKFFKVASFHLRVLHNKLPDLLYDMLIASPKMVSFECHEPLSNNHMKLIADSCPNLKNLDLSVEQNLDSEVGKLEFNDVGLQAVGDACIHLVYVDLSGRLRFKEIGIGSLVRSCKKLSTLILTDCVNVTDKSLKIIAEATCLKILHLQGCYLISDLGLEYLANGDFKHCLDRLYLGKCDRITDNGIIHLKKLVTLSTLSFDRCGGKITDYGIVALCELPNIKSLNLERLFNITDISLLEIGRKCLNITSVSFDGCRRITGVGLRAFSGHRHLLVLNLISCYNISWEDVQSLALTLPKLVIIRLSRSMKKPLPEAGHQDFYINNGNSCFRIQWK
nr:hypothetical protein [Tanacetum cinerariifolium]